MFVCCLPTKKFQAGLRQFLFASCPRKSYNFKQNRHKYLAKMGKKYDQVGGKMLDSLVNNKPTIFMVSLEAVQLT